MSTSPIMTLFREWEAKFAEAGDMAKTTEEQSEVLLDRCSIIEHQMLSMPAVSAPEFAAKLIASTSYGGFSVDENGLLITEARTLVAENVEHPDAKLIELGRLFEETRAAAIQLDRQRKAAYLACDEVMAEAGIPEAFADRTAEQDEFVKSLHNEPGFRSALDAFNRVHGKLIRLMKSIHRAKATTLEGFAIKAMAVAFDHADFEVGDPVPTDVAERQLYRLARDMAKVVKANAKTGGAA